VLEVGYAPQSDRPFVEDGEFQALAGRARERETGEWCAKAHLPGGAAGCERRPVGRLSI
jgi:hypothetical protein